MYLPDERVGRRVNSGGIGGQHIDVAARSCLEPPCVVAPDERELLEQSLAAEALQVRHLL